ncbi:MAG: RNA-binding transcriptional accessory protein [Oscillospiraceae bacterium]|nr:RNA-binding transcriptional accessory protein [Oscillospiraceae bacterium]
MDILQELQQEFNLKSHQVENTVKLLDEGNTIPFIARYRKELTGSLDDQILREISERLTYLRNLEARKEEIRESIIAQEKMTDEIALAIDNAQILSELEDIYRPFRPKRKTRASVAKERGLEPLAEIILAQDNKTNPYDEAQNFVDEEKGVPDVDSAIQGALDIIAEMASDNADVRKKLRLFIKNTGIIETKATDSEQDTVYNMYYEFNEPVNKIAGHRILAIDRGEKDEAIKVNIIIDKERAIAITNEFFVTSDNQCTELVKNACADGFERLIFPSLEREIRNELTETACEQAIKVFAVNLKQLLMQPPVHETVTLGLDPAYRTGCKIAVVDQTGRVLDHMVVFPTPPQNKIDEAKLVLTRLIKKYGVTAIAIGNGTASRESEAFVASLLKDLGQSDLSYMIVSEAGASVYSASKLAAAEFPEFDVTVRSAVSIARRLQDPLAELVKIDPKAIGVGQYQHDMPKARLDEALGGVVEACVNTVGVDLNTASQPLLARVAGINATVAKNIVTYREENGAFTDRKTLLKVEKLGKKAFEQCAGFLRVRAGKNVLDNTGVHPESYAPCTELLKLCGYSLEDVANGNILELKERAEKITLKELSAKLGIGEITISDIIDELLKPGRDPRDELEKPLLRSDVLELSDLKAGMELKGTVRNITDFGAFVDIGVHEDGLVHISQMSNKFIKHPLDVVKVGQIVTVWVMEVDEKRKRISLTMKAPKPENN